MSKRTYWEQKCMWCGESGPPVCDICVTLSEPDDIQPVHLSLFPQGETEKLWELVGYGGKLFGVQRRGGYWSPRTEAMRFEMAGVRFGIKADIGPFWKIRIHVPSQGDGGKPVHYGLSFHQSASRAALAVIQEATRRKFNEVVLEAGLGRLGPSHWHPPKVKI